MSQHIACKLCIATEGLLGSNIKNLPTTEEEMFTHLESVHHIIVRRKGETDEAAEARYRREYPEAT